MTSGRWNKAQKAEKKYWSSTKEDWSNSEPRVYWQEILNLGFDINFDFFRGKDVLEIGCGPSGIIFLLDNAKSRVGIEPMDLSNLIDETWKEPIVKKGIGEELPFEDSSFDIVISFNALDHSIDPGKVIREAYRVLRYDGTFLLWIYTLHNGFTPLKGLLNKIDSPHPHHFTFKEILTKVSDNSFSIKMKKHKKRTGLENDTIKRIFGNLMMDRAWIWSVKSPPNS